MRPRPNIRAALLRLPATARRCPEIVDESDGEPQPERDAVLPLAASILPVVKCCTANAWYRDGLGFREIYRMLEYGWCELRSPITNVSIGNPLTLAQPNKPVSVAQQRSR